MNMIADYFKESQGYECLEVPEVGFVLFRVLGTEFHVGHLYITPSMRGSRLSESLGKSCETLALELGCTHLSGTVIVTDGNKETCSKLLNLYLKFGCRIEELSGNAMIFKKELVK